jgi:CheY-like chemotaxis protein
MGMPKKPRLETTLATLRLTLRTALRIRGTALQLGADRLVALEEEDIIALEGRVACLEWHAARLAAPPRDQRAMEVSDGRTAAAEHRAAPAQPRSAAEGCPRRRRRPARGAGRAAHRGAGGPGRRPDRPPGAARGPYDAPGEAGQRARQHILAVNGDPDLLNIVRTLLQDERYNVTTTNYVPRTFAQIAALQPALLLIDLAVGHRDGWDLLERLRVEARTFDIPVIITGDRRLLDHALADQLRYGGQRLLPKPLDLDRLLAAIDELIGAA